MNCFNILLRDLWKLKLIQVAHRAISMLYCLQLSDTHALGLHSSQSRLQSFLHKHSLALPVRNVISSYIYQANVNLSTCIDMNNFKCIQACSRQAENSETSNLIQSNNRSARYGWLLYLNLCLENPFNSLPGRKLAQLPTLRSSERMQAPASSPYMSALAPGRFSAPSARESPKPKPKTGSPAPGKIWQKELWSMYDALSDVLQMFMRSQSPLSFCNCRKRAARLCEKQYW